jgi:hypothetical protein
MGNPTKSSDMTDVASAAQAVHGKIPNHSQQSPLWMYQMSDGEFLINFERGRVESIRFRPAAS